MATRAEIAQLELKLQGSVSLTWVVSGQPVVALFSKQNSVERDFLGHPSPHNQVSDSLLLWIGLNEQTGHLLITLTQRIKVSTTSRGRLMFLVVPSEALVLKSSAPAFWTLSEENIPLSLLDKPSDEVSAQTSRLLHMSFSLGIEKTSKVIMPLRRYEGRVRPTPMLLLQKLKALSESSCFDLFTNHNSWAQLGLHKTHQILENSSIATTTPVVDLSALYPGERDGGIDLWTAQGWCDQEKSENLKSCSGKNNRPERFTKPAAKKRRIWSDSPAPPPYEPQPRSSPSPVDGVADIPIPHNVSKNTSAIRKTATSSTSTSTPFLVDDAEHPSQCSPATEDTVPGPVLLSPAPLPLTASIDEAALASSVASASNSDAILQSPVQLQSIPETYNAGELSESCIPETPKASLRAGIERVFIEPCGNLSMKHTEEPLPRVMLDNQILLWLLKAWEVCPYAHYIFINELLLLGAAALSSDEKTFHTSRVACMDALLSYCAKQELAKVARGTASPLVVPRGRAIFAKRQYVQNETSALISWLLILDSTADMKFMSPLMRLAVMKEQILQRCEHETEDDISQITLDFTNLKAVIVTEACVQLGAQILQQKKEITLAMLSEKNRFEAMAEEL